MLYIFYSDSMIGKDGLLYLNHIRKQVAKRDIEKDIRFKSLDRLGCVGIINYLEKEIKEHGMFKFLMIKNVKNYQKCILDLYEKRGLINIESSEHYNKEHTTPTVDAILKTIGTIKGKRIVVINRSDILGKPLVNKLVNNGATVLWVSKYEKKDLKEDIEKADVLVSATGGRINLSNIDFSKVKQIIDLSGDTNYPNAITRIPTVDILLNKYI